jgi:hypothetical protein
LKLTAVLAFTVLLLTSCKSAPPPAGPFAPEWEAIPSGIAETLCLRLKMDAIATGAVTIVQTTQPLATPVALSALANITKRRGKVTDAPIVNRVVPIALTGGGACAWTAIDVSAIPRHQDEMIVELSAPVPNPYAAGEAGMFARVTLAGEHATWYWLPLTQHAGGWTAGIALPLSL